VVTFLLLFLALICFGVAAFNVTVSRVNLVALGLALWMLTLVIPAWPG
jgi:hypothetical protein